MSTIVEQQLYWHNLFHYHSYKKASFMTFHTSIANLSDIADIKAGYAFRGRVVEDLEGVGFVIQPSDVDADGIINWNLLTSVSFKTAPHFLENGDIIFLARGGKTIATYLDKVDKPSVCPSYYFVIRVNEQYKSTISPAFIAWQLNQDKLQHYFISIAEGSSQKSIKRKALEDAELYILPLAKQMEIANLVILAKEELQHMNDVRHSRRLQIKLLTNEISDRVVGGIIDA
jgi:hypothetical protein